jgi:ABC-type dipeptide/oligopeptide/nickel transport system permease subunit
VVAPGVTILLTVFSVFLIADGLRDALDPRLT